MMSMLGSLGLVFLIGLGLAGICERIKVPRIIGMLMTGVLLGPFVLDLLAPDLLQISPDLRKMALVIILIKAGLSLNIADLKKIGRPALMMSFIPAAFEIAAYVLFAPGILGITVAEAAVMGAVLGAVSPAVVVPRMVQLMDEGYGTDKQIPQMVLAGASLDDIFVIVLFSTFMGIAQGGHVNAAAFMDIPVSIVLGILLGSLVGLILSRFFEYEYQHGHLVRNSAKTVVVLGVSFLLIALEDLLKGTIALSGLLAVMSMAMVLAMKSIAPVKTRLQEKFGKLWIAAEVILFVLIGAAVDIRYTLAAGGGALLMIALALIFRGLGVMVCMLGTRLSLKERLFCIIAYLPKATVQAAIGSIPLAAGLPCGKMVLSVAVLAILTTAPLGALGMDCTYRRLLSKAGEHSAD